MNAVQETILDRLMAVDQIGALWTPGPLRLACEAVRGAGLSDRTTPDEALGYPLIFCRALEGGSAVLEKVDELRTLAITIFTEVPPRPQSPMLSSRRQGEVAFWAARQIRIYHEEVPGPIPGGARLLQDYLADQEVPEAVIETVSRQLRLSLRRVRQNAGEPFSAGSLALSAWYFTLHAMRQAQEGKDAEENTGRACRDVARLATLTRGLKGAITYCLALAQTLEM